MNGHWSLVISRGNDYETDQEKVKAKLPLSLNE
jgi:hypothetical protein